MRVGFIVLFTFRLEIILFHAPQATGGAWAVGFFRDGSRWGWFGQVFTVLASDSFSLFSIEIISMFPKSYMLVTRAPKDPT